MERAPLDVEKLFVVEAVLISQSEVESLGSVVSQLYVTLHSGGLTKNGGTRFRVDPSKVYSSDITKPS